MVHCPNCNTKCVEGANYCHHCGIYLIEDSSVDGRSKDTQPANQEEVNLALRRLMPSHYINKLLSTKGHVEGERRVVTILFSDVKGSTSLAENLDPEEVLEIMNGAFEVLIKPITRYEGTIARLMGDAILAFFGAPIAHEDDPDRACRAALEIINGAKDYSKKLAKEKGIEGFNVRVGINTGLVVVAEVGTDLRVEYTAMGDAVNIAARMESAAESGTIMITEDTKKLIENNFETIPLGPINVKGKEKPLNVYQLKKIRKVGSKGNNNGFYSPIVGREYEMSAIQEILELLARGKGNIISISGDHGLGKSRLTYECQVRSPKGIKWVEGRALAYNANDGYRLIRDVLKKLILADKEYSGEKLRSIIRNYISSLPGLNFDEIYPYLAYLLKVDLEKKYKKKIQLSDAETLKGQIHYACKEFVRVECLKQSLAIVLEDMHWSDTPSRELLNDLFQLCNSLPVLFLLDFRMNEGEIWKLHEHNLKTNNKHYQVFQLKELSDEDCRILIKNLAGDYSVENELRDAIIEKTGGNPFFIEEVLRSLIDQELINKGNGKNTDSPKEKLVNVPNLLQNCITSRMDCLSLYQKSLLQSASIVGRYFTEELLFIIVENHTNEREIGEELLELVRKGFLLENKNNESNFDDSNHEREYYFKHSILQDVISDSLLLKQKRKLHILIGEAMEKIYSEKSEDLAPSLAFHFEEGKNFEKAIYYYQIAAENSKKIFANNDAIFFYCKIINITENNSLNFDLPHIFESVGDLYFQTAEFSKAIEYFSKIFNLITKDVKVATIFYKCGKVYERWGKYDDAILSYNTGLKKIARLSEDKIHGQIHNGIGMIFYRRGDLEKAEKHHMIALRIFETVQSEIDLADVYNNLGIIFCKLGKLDTAMGFHKQCLDIREKFSHTSGLAASYNNLGYLYQLMGVSDKAINYYEKSINYCEKTGNQHGLAKTYDNLSHVYLAQSKEEIAMSYNLKAISILGRIALDNSVVQHDVWLQSGVW